MNKILSAVIIICSLLSVGIVEPKLVEKDKSNWTCVDYSLDYTKAYPNWGCLTLDDHILFRGRSHMVNYKVLDHDTLLIHDGLYNADYKYAGWRDDGNYYHFWINESPMRVYRFLRDNRAVLD